MISTFKFIFIKLWEIPTIQLIIIFSITGIFCWILLGILKMVLLDAIYEKKGYRFLYDHFLPSMLLLSPWVLVLFYGLSYKFFLLSLVLYITIVVPSIRVFSLIRKWEVIEENEEIRTFFSWKNPKVFVTLSVAVIYPLIYGLMFTVLRYLRMGKTIDISGIFNYSIDMYIIFLVLFVWLFLLILGIIRIIIGFLWSQTLLIVYSLNLLLIKYKTYFKIMQNLHKLHHIIVSLIRTNGDVFNIEKQHLPPWHRAINFIYWNTQWINYFVLFFTVLEGGLTSKLHYSLYLLFYYNVIRSILYAFSEFGWSFWIRNCCLSDYFYKNFENPHYKYHFWSVFEDMQETKYAYEFTDQERKVLILLEKTHEWKLTKQDITGHCWDLRQRMHNSINYHVCMRIRGSYQTRWTHTKVMRDLNFYQKVVLVNENWGNIKFIEKLEKQNKSYLPYPSDIYIPLPQVWQPKNLQPNFIKCIEQNTPTHFEILMREGVLVKPYENEAVEFKPQPNPDIYFNFEKSNFKMKINISNDLKSSQERTGRNKILSMSSLKKYNEVLDRFASHLQYNNYSSSKCRQVLNLLKITASNKNEHQLIWASNLHLFPCNWIPPVHVQNNFSLHALNNQSLMEIAFAKKALISDGYEFVNT